MEGFKSLPKMQCFKEGGAVKSKYAAGGSCYKKGGHAESEEVSKDIAKDKSMIKRGVKQHEEALHKDEPKTKLKLKKGGHSKVVGKYQTGGMVGQGAVSDYERNIAKDAAGQGAISDTERLRLLNRAKNRAMLSPTQQKELDAQEAAAALKGQGAVTDAERRNMMGRKKGGTIKKYAEGGSLKPVDKQENPGLAKLPTNVRNKMGYAKKGGKVC